MSVDPSDDCTFWYANQYYGSVSNGSIGNWQTRIGSFSLCDPNALVEKVSDGIKYPSIGAAYAAITADDSLDVQDITFYEDLTLSNSYRVTINGGYDSSFLPFSGFSAVHGTVTISGVGGSVQFNGLSIQ